MKGFLISTGIVVALIIVGISQVSNICMSLLEKSQAIEGGPAAKEAFERLKFDSPAVFRQKYEEAVKFRLWAGKLAFYLAEDDAFKLVAESSRELYLGTEFDNNNDFVWLLFRLAETLEARQPDIYLQRMIEIQTHNPNSSYKDDLDRKIKLMKTRLNIAMVNPTAAFS